jgi:archaemetzincin
MTRTSIKARLRKSGTVKVDPVKEMARIILIKLTDFNGTILDVLKRKLEKTFSRNVEVRNEILNLGFAFDPGRKQYRSPLLLDRLRRIEKRPADRVMGVVDKDLYTPGFDFIFGEAEVVSGIATLSLYRLKPESYGMHSDPKIFGQRSGKEAVHELGHLYNLDHCQEPACVMRFSTSIVEVDRKSPEFCVNCGLKLKNIPLNHR